MFRPRSTIVGPLLFLAVCTSTQLPLMAGEKPVKVFILVGQSNMEGHAKVETFDYLEDDPETAMLLKKMRDADGEPRICDGAWISYYTGRGEQNGEGFGKLTAGYGSRPKPAEDGGKIGPEFTFGITMDEAFEEPVLIIKTAWGENRYSTTSARRALECTRGRRTTLRKSGVRRVARGITTG